MKTNEAINEVIEWLKTHAMKYHYSEISIKLVIHNQRIKRIEKNICEKIQVDVEI